MSFNSNDFRNSMGCFATGITVVTTKNAEGNHGVTVNSFASVSLLPPLVSFCIDKNAHSYDHFVEANDFAINILAEDQQDISQIFAHPTSVNWENLEFEQKQSPIIKDVVTYIECKKEVLHDAGDHTIVIGKVLNLGDINNKKPLLYYTGNYRKIGK